MKGVSALKYVVLIFAMISFGTLTGCETGGDGSTVTVSDGMPAGGGGGGGGGGC